MVASRGAVFWYVGAMRSGWLSVVLIALGIGCGAQPEVPVVTLPAPEADSPIDRWVAEGEPLDVPPSGDCGGLASLGAGSERSVLSRRLWMRVPGDATSSTMPFGVMSAPPSLMRQEIVWLGTGDTRVAVVTEELLRTSSDPALVPEGDGVAPLGAHGGVAATPSLLRDADGDVRLLQLFQPAVDGLVVRVSFFTSPDVARTGGCLELARRLASTVRPGTRRIELDGGARVIGGDWVIDIAAGHALYVDTGPDFSVYRVVAVTPLLGRGGSLGLYFGSHPSFAPPEGATERTTSMLGADVTWYDAADEHSSEALVPAESAFVHVFYGSADDSVRAALATSAESLRRVEPSPRPSFCGEASADVARAPVVDGEDVALLRAAARFALVATALGEPEVAEAAAFRRVLTRPDADAALLDLIAHGTTAGRLYGLAGLRAIDPVTFRRVACAARDALDPTVRTLGFCGESEAPTPELFERTEANAIRGETHWSEYDWRSALGTGISDVVGGGLGYQLAFLRRTELAEAARTAGTAGAAGLAPTVIGAPSRARRPRGAPRIVEVGYGGFCVFRSTGRVACWGSGFTRGVPRVRELPDLVRNPLDVELGSVSCMLDADAQRICWHDPGSARATVTELCSTAFETGPVVMRFDDGPWRDLMRLATRTCGLHDDGSLRCFVGGSRPAPGYARAAELGIGQAWRVPIEGRVVGAVDGGSLDSYAWTDDGRVFLLDGDEPPREIGRLDGITRIVAGIAGPAFVELSDGRVMAWGLRGFDESSRTFWARSGPPDERWVEIETLRGGRLEVSDYHGCAAFEEGRVVCWGSNDYGEIGAPGEREVPREVPALGGSTALFLQPQVSCGLRGRDTLRCIGLRVPDLSPERIDGSERGPRDFELPF